MQKAVNRQNNLFEAVVNSDPTIKFYLIDGHLGGCQFDHKITLRMWAFKYALKKYLDYKYPTKSIHK